MKITIITITRNNARGLKYTLDSLACQITNADIEHIIVDGMSTDDTDAVISNAVISPIVIKREPRGVYDAINAGIECAGGDIIGLLHAGDRFSAPDIIEHVADTFTQHPDCDFLFGDLHFENDKGKTLRYYTGANASRQAIIHGFQPPHPTLYIRRETQTAVGLYRPGYRVSGDFEMFVRLFSRPELKWQYLPLDMVTMSPGGLSSTLYNRLWGHNRERMRAFRDNGIHSSYLKIMSNYLYVLKSFLWRHPHNK